MVSDLISSPSRPVASKSRPELVSGEQQGQAETSDVKLWKNPFDFALFQADVESVVGAASSRIDGVGGDLQPPASLEDRRWKPINSDADEELRDDLAAPGGGDEPASFDKAPGGGTKALNVEATRAIEAGKPCSCPEASPSVGFCQECSEYLCSACVSAHRRVRLTSKHAIVDLNLPQQLISTVCDTPSGPAQSLTCSSHAQSCQPAPPSEAVMRVYEEAVENTRQDAEQLLIKARSELVAIDETVRLVDTTREAVRQRIALAAAKIKEVTGQYVNALHNYERVTLIRLHQIGEIKLAVLDNQSQSLVTSNAAIVSVVKKLRHCLAGCKDDTTKPTNDVALIDMHKQALHTLKQFHKECGPLHTTREDDRVDFILTAASSAHLGPDNLCAMLFTISGSGFGPNSVAEGDGLIKGVVGNESSFIVRLKDQLGEPRTTGGDFLCVQVEETVANSRQPERCEVHILDREDGSYRITWRPRLAVPHSISVCIKGLPLRDSPFVANVRDVRNYACTETFGRQPRFQFGIEGPEDGQLFRPWGICCSRDGQLVLVANRSNNRIEAFDAETGAFRYNFGRSGKMQGQFDRPTSVACDSQMRLIVVDKDNHRVQVFTLAGKFLMKFGNKGFNVGQFNYPWDVAVNSVDQILISDTRNHRIQLFDKDGQFLEKYGFEGPLTVHFDSPRGVAFTLDDRAVVTDFNNHRLLIIRRDYVSAQFLGKEGSEPGMFVRPNGVAIDDEGNIIVTDSRNDRVQIFNPKGVLIRFFGMTGSGQSHFDRPSGVCVSPDGSKIYVVDFGHNRVLVF